MSKDSDKRTDCWAEIDRLEAELTALRKVAEASDKALAAVIALRNTERAQRMLGPCGANDAGKVLSYTVGPEEMSELNGASVVLQDALAEWRKTK